VNHHQIVVQITVIITNLLDSILNIQSEQELTIQRWCSTYVTFLLYDITCLHSICVLQHTFMQTARMIQSMKSEVEWPGFNSQQREGVFLLLPNPDQFRGLPSLLLSNWYQGHSPWEVKKTHSPPHSTEVKNVWAYDSTPFIFIMVRYLMEKKKTLNLSQYIYMQTWRSRGENKEGVWQSPCNSFQGHPHLSSPPILAHAADHTLMLRSRMHGACLWSLDSSVGIATGYGPDDRGIGVRVPVGSRIFSSARRPDRLCGPPNLLSNGYRRLFPRG
jgi:hypothetical protein